MPAPKIKFPTQLSKFEWYAFVAFLTLLAFILCAKTVLGIEFEFWVFVLGLLLTAMTTAAGFKFFGIRGLYSGIVFGSTFSATIATGMPLISIATTIAVGIATNWSNGWIWGMRISLCGALVICSAAALFVVMGMLEVEFGPQG